jgi:hypothetical protein
MGPIGPVEDEIWPNHGFGSLMHKKSIQNRQKTTETSRSHSIPSALINRKRFNQNMGLIGPVEAEIWSVHGFDVCYCMDAIL